MSFSKLLVRNIFFRGTGILVSLATTILLTRLMGTEGYGILALLVANASIFSLVSCLGSESGITYHYASGSIKRSRIFSIIYIIIFFQLALLLLFEFVFFNFAGHYWVIDQEQGKFLLWGLVYLFSITVIDKYTAFFNGNHLYTLSNKIIFFSNAVTLVLFAAIYFFYEKQEPIFYLQIFIVASFLQAIVMVFSFHLFSGQKLAFEKNVRNDWKLFFSYSFIVFITNVIQFLAYRVDYWLVDHYKGTDELGLYSLAVRLCQLLWVLPLLFASIIFPKVADKNSNYQTSDFLKLARITNTFLFIILIPAAVLASWVIPIFFGSAFKNSATVFLYLLPGFFFFCSNIMLAAYFAGLNKLKINLTGSVICFILVLLLDLWLIPTKGIYGAAIASSIAYTAATAYSTWRFILIERRPLKDLFLMQKQDWVLAKNYLKKNLTGL